MKYLSLCIHSTGYYRVRDSGEKEIHREDKKCTLHREEKIQGVLSFCEIIIVQGLIKNIGVRRHSEILEDNIGIKTTGIF